MIYLRQLLRDSQFHCNGYIEPCEDDWLAIQLLATLDSLPNQTTEVQTDLMKVRICYEYEIWIENHLFVFFLKDTQFYTSSS